MNGMSARLFSSTSGLWCGIEQVYDIGVSLPGLAEAIDELVTVDPTSMSDAELHRHTVTLHRLESRLAVVRAEATAAWDARRMWAEDGSKSPAARLARECGLDPATAKAELCRARKLRSMPVVRDALARGLLSVDKADLLARARTAKTEALFRVDESMLVNLIGPMRYSTAAKAVAYWRSCARDATGEPFTERQTARRNASCDRTFRGGVHFSGFLPKVAGTALYDEVHRLERQLFDADLAAARQEHGDDAIHHLPRTGAQRLADAFMLMAARSAGADAGRPARPLLTVLVGYETFKGRVCELEDGTVTEPEELRDLLATADIERVVFDGPSRVIDVGARTRLFTGALRRAIQVRDRTCRDPSGCEEPANRCEIDHAVEYEDGGETTQDNGQLECRVHNRRKHREKRKRRARQRAGLRQLERWRRRMAAEYERDHPDPNPRSPSSAHAPPQRD